MKKVNRFILEEIHYNKLMIEGIPTLVRLNLRECQNCNLYTLFGMPGGRDAICQNCGYKDPCCSD